MTTDARTRANLLVAAQSRVTGMYRWVRHPIYAGLLLASAGRTITAGGRRQLGRTLGLVGLLNYKAGFEERALRRRFPGYGRCAAKTSRFLPVPWNRAEHLGLPHCEPSD